MAEPNAPMHLCVCVPARNEAARLPILLNALARQDWVGPIPVVIAINNTEDDSIQVVEAAREKHAGRLHIALLSEDFPPEMAHAGSARRIAMDAGLSLMAEYNNAILVSTDADTRPPRDWLTNMAAAFARGADIVGGRIEIDMLEPLSAHALRIREAWDRYWMTVRAIEDNVDPQPSDPAPRHGDHTGASLAIRADVYRTCGGVPLLPTGEDRALVNAALAQGARLAHPQDVYTYVSPRTDGRAEGGMAVAMQDLLATAHSGTIPMAPAFNHWRARAIWRRQLRAQPNGHVLIAQQEPLLPQMPHDMALDVAP